MAKWNLRVCMPVRTLHEWQGAIGADLVLLWTEDGGSCCREVVVTKIGAAPELCIQHESGATIVYDATMLATLDYRIQGQLVGAVSSASTDVTDLVCNW